MQAALLELLYDQNCLFFINVTAEVELKGTDGEAHNSWN